MTAFVLIAFAAFPADQSLPVWLAALRLSPQTRKAWALAGRAGESKCPLLSSYLFDIWNISFVFVDPGEEKLYQESETTGQLQLLVLDISCTSFRYSASFGPLQGWVFLLLVSVLFTLQIDSFSNADS